MTDERHMKATLPTSWDHVYTVARDCPWTLAVHKNDRVMALYNIAIQDNTASIMLEEAKTGE